MRWLRRVLLIVALCLAAATPPAHAQSGGDAPTQTLFRDWEALAARAEKAVADDTLSAQTLSDLRTGLTTQRAAARMLADNATKSVAPIKAQLDALGPPPTDGAPEDAQVAADRAALDQKLNEQRGVAQRAELAFARADSLLAQIAELERIRFTNNLLAKAPSPLTAATWTTFGDEATRAIKAGGERLFAAFGDVERGLAILVAALGVGALITIFFGLSWAIKRWLTPQLGLYLRRSDYSVAATILVALLKFVARIAPWAIVGFGVVGVVTANEQVLGGGAVHLATQLYVAVLGVTMLHALGQLVFSPYEQRLRLLELDDRAARGALRLSTALATLFMTHRLVVYSWLDPEKGAVKPLWSPASLSVISFCFLLAAATVFWRLARLAAPSRQQPQQGDDANAPDADKSEGLRAAFRGVALLMAITLPVLSALGYYQLTTFIFSGVVGSAAATAVAAAIYAAARQVVWAGVGDSEDEAGLRAHSGRWLAQLVAVCVVFAGWAVTLALLWGASINDLQEVWRKIAFGFQVGDYRLQPIDLIFGVGVFFLLMSLTRAFQATLRKRVMPSLRVEPGAANSIASGVGYVGGVGALLLGVSTAGLDLSNLAIVAGALSVGIGFGLQTVVNNFVSGLILLVERPIKIGDWVKTADGQGYVKRIKVRSTEIETFDQSTLIVPNSQLVASTVENWTHNNTTGRVIAPVGVAYGSDTQQVRAILMEIARAHPMATRIPAPNVLFTAFGDSALNFEIRMYIRDVNYMGSVRSDLLFEIERRFREEGIAIPFPQRELTLRGVDAQAFAALAALRGGANPSEGAQA